jgi:hypothetical protein
MSLLFGILDPVNINTNKYERAKNLFKITDSLETVTDHKNISFHSVRLWANKPVVKEFDNHYVAFSGRCYNTIKLAEKLKGEVFIADLEDPCEIIAKGVLTKGTGFLQEVDGAFSIAIYSAAEQQLTLANDRYGFYPLFISENGQSVGFCNEYEPLLQLPFTDKSIDKESLAEFLVYGLIPNNNTLVKGITQLRAGSVFIHDGLKSIVSSYLRLNKIKKHRVTIAEAGNDIAHLLQKAVDKRANYSNHVSADISGGLDTRLIICCLNKEQRQKIEFVTKVTPPLTSNNDRDVIIAKQIAAELNLNFKVEYFNYWDTNFGAHYFSNWREDRYHHQHIKGLYGGEFLNGDAKNFLSPNYTELIGGGLTKKDKTFYGQPISEIIQFKYNQLNIDPPKNVLEEIIHSFSSSFFTNIYGGANSLWVHPFTFLTKIDTPFLDAELIDYIIALPNEYLSGGEEHPIHHQLFKHHFNELNHVPTCSVIGKLENPIIPGLDSGLEPKLFRPVNNKTILEKLIADKSHPLYDYINRNSFTGHNHETNTAFTDLAAWLEYYKQLIVV